MIIDSLWDYIVCSFPLGFFMCLAFTLSLGIAASWADKKMEGFDADIRRKTILKEGCNSGHPLPASGSLPKRGEATPSASKIPDI